MTPETLLRLLEAVSTGSVAPETAGRRLSTLLTEELVGGGIGTSAGPHPDPSTNGAAADEAATVFARLDHHRALRQGHPEVVYCPGKTTAQIVEICRSFATRGGSFLATRADDDARAALAAEFPAAAINDLGRTVFLAAPEAERAAAPALGTVLVVSAGTADLPVAEEAAVTAAALGNPVQRLYDVGVAGLHRLLERTDVLRGAAVVIVVAGMEGALPSVVAGLVPAPVIAVPTSVGYGASFGGVSALLSMLTSCAAGLTVVNIDNGFGAGVAATRINRLAARQGTEARAG